MRKFYERVNIYERKNKIEFNVKIKIKKDKQYYKEVLEIVEVD